MAREIRLLLVEEGRARADLRRLLTDPSLALVGEAGYGTEAVTVARDCAPHVIVIGFAEPVARPLRTIEALTLAYPNVGIVVVSSLGDREAMRKAMRAGARDFLVRPVEAAELARAIQGVYEAVQRQQALSSPEQQQSLQRGDIFAVFGPKGGIGKTTIAVNLATAIAQESKQRVALVDLDLQMGDVALFLSLAPERSVADVVGLNAPLDPEVVQSLLATDRSGLRVLPAPARPDEGTDLDAARVGQVLEGLARTFDYTVVDTSNIISDLTLAVFEQATLIFLLTAPELPSLKRTKITLDLLLRVWHFPEERIKLVINYPHAPNGLLLSDLENALDYPIFWKVPYDPTVVEAVKAGRPCVEFRQGARFSRNMVELARTICGLQTGSGGLLGGLFGRR